MLPWRSLPEGTRWRGEGRGAGGFRTRASGGERLQTYLCGKGGSRQSEGSGDIPGAASLGFLCLFAFKLLLSEFLIKEVCAHDLKISDSPGKIREKAAETVCCTLLLTPTFSNGPAQPGRWLFKMNSAFSLSGCYLNAYTNSSL